MVPGISAALSVGSISREVVAVEARKASTTSTGDVVSGEPVVISLLQRRETPQCSPRAVRGGVGLLGDDRPLSTVDDYDQLPELGGPVSKHVPKEAATAAIAAIDSGTRVARLPTIRDRFAEIATAAEREQLTCVRFLA